MSWFGTHVRRSPAMNKLEVLTAFETAALDPLPTGLEAARFA